MLEAVKKALGITSNAAIIVDEIQDLIQAALYDLQSNGVRALVIQAVKTYCRAFFHSPADYDNLLRSYEQQKGHLMNCTGYTDWPGGDIT